MTRQQLITCDSCQMQLVTVRPVHELRLVRPRATELGSDTYSLDLCLNCYRVVCTAVGLDANHPAHPDWRPVGSPPP